MRKEPGIVGGSSASKITLTSAAFSLKTAIRTCAADGKENCMLYEGLLAPGRRPTEAQIATVLFPLVPNLLQSSHAVSWEPGKNFCGEWMPFELQPARTTMTRIGAATASRGLSWSALLSGGRGPGPQNRREAAREAKKI